MLDLVNLANDCLVALTQWLNLIAVCSGIGCCGGLAVCAVVLTLGVVSLYRRYNAYLEDEPLAKPIRGIPPPEIDHEAETEQDDNPRPI